MNRTQQSPRELVADLWKRIPQEHGHPPVEPPDLDQFLKEHGASESARATESLEPWTTLSAEALLWMSHLHICLEDCVGVSPRHQSIWALTGLATTQALAVRTLVLSGLDVQARSLMRTYVEALMAAVIFLNDENLAERYVQAQDPAEARQLWYEELRSKQLRKKFEAVVDGSNSKESQALREFTEWFELENSDYSQAVHASYMAAVMASMPPDIDHGEMVPGIFGLATEASFRTLRLLFDATWFFSRFVARGIIGLDGDRTSRLRSFSPEKHFDSVVISGCYILGVLSERYWDSERAV